MILRTFVVIIIIATLSVQASSVGPVRFFGKYTWEASLDRSAGLAQSREHSKVKQRSKLNQSLQNLNDQELLRLTEDMLRSYPSFLCRWTVTLGLLRAVPKKHGQVDVRLLGVTLLKFGRVSGQRVSYQSFLDGVPVQTSKCTVKLPMLGGALVRPVVNGKGNAFVLTLTKNSSDLATECELETSLFNYKVGKNGVNWLRGSWYLGTRSLIHAYTSWRFHRMCWKYDARRKEEESLKVIGGGSSVTRKGAVRLPTVDGLPISGIEVDWKERKFTVH